MPEPIREPHFAQVAISTPDMPRSLRFYQEVLGLRLAGGRYTAGPGLERVQGLPDPACVMWWLVNEQPFFQVELFQYTTPAPAPRPRDWRPSDIGYSKLAFEVQDVAVAVAAAERLGAPVRSNVSRVNAQLRACVDDPAGIPIELIEDQRAPTASPLVSVAASVPDLAAAERWFADCLGLGTGGRGLDGGREALAGLPGAEGGAAQLSAGHVGIELTQYTLPVPRPRPEGFRINDHGILNVALGYREWPEFNDAYERVVHGGYHAQTEPLGPGGIYDVSYCMDGAGFSVELLYCPESSDALLGFVEQKGPF